MQGSRSAANLAMVLGVLVFACSRRAPVSERTEPWAARSATPTQRTAPLRWKIGEGSEAHFTLVSKERRLEGVFRAARGELETDLYDLGRTRGTVSIDLASVTVAGDVRLDPELPAAEQAQDWFEIGPGVPTGVREKHRWAQFTLEQVENASPRAPHQGRRPAPSSTESASAASPSDAGPEEVREATLDARGRLLLHGYQVELGVPVRLIFHYRTPPSAGQRPTFIAITTRSPVVVSLAAHDIKPRDSRGNVLARELRWLGTGIGREASVSVSLLGTPLP